MGIDTNANFCRYRLPGYCFPVPGSKVEEEVFTACSLKLTDSLKKDYSDGKISDSALRIFGCPYGGLGQIAIEGCSKRESQ